ncbi:MAG: FAD-dependent oxidoreductase [Cloacibacillus sp.]
MHTVIIGNGAAGLAAVRAFRKYDKQSRITVISKEGGAAYSRVLLPYVLRGKLSYDKLFLPYAERFEELGVNYVEDEVLSLNDASKEISLARSGVLPYDKLLIASGSRALWPPVKGVEQEGIHHLWTRKDLDALIEAFKEKRHVLIIGSGFVSLQAAWSARSRGLDVTLVEIADRLMPLVLDERGSALMAEQMEKFGVKVFTSTITNEIIKNDDGSFRILLKDGGEIDSDLIIVGAGVGANIDFLKGSGVEFGRTIPVDSFMRTNVPDVFAAGDAAAGPSAFGDEHVTHALWPTAVEMGAVAGSNMAGKNISYDGSLNMNVTHMFNVTVASMGKFNSKDIDESYVYDAEAGKGYCKLCYQDGLIVGICLVGVAEAVSMFGRLRPIIRKHLAVECSPTKLDAFLNIRYFER